MSITNTDLIADALREIGVIAETETPSAEQGETALRKLNQMMFEWEEDSGIRLGWCEQTSLSDDCPIPPYAESGVTMKLALRVAPGYGSGASVTPALIVAAGEAFKVILRKAVNAQLQPVQTDRPQGEGQRDAGGSIEHG